jgi:hypothetical protein
MEHHPERPDLTLQLPRDTYYQVVHTLRGLLPPPVADTPDALVHRDNAAIAQVASLLPANADEANLAAQYVAPTPTRWIAFGSPANRVATFQLS